MCGVLVFISDAGSAAAQSDAIAAALESQHHRGPDETGVVLAGRDVIFAHKRLSIIDVELSHEPLPLQFPAGRTADSLGLTGTETFAISGVTALNDGTTPRTVQVSTDTGVSFDAVVRIDTPGEADYYRHGGILQYVLRKMLAD